MNDWFKKQIQHFIEAGGIQGQILVLKIKGKVCEIVILDRLET